MGFFGKSADGSSIRLIVNKEALAQGLALRFDRPLQTLEKLGISSVDFDRSRAAFAEEASRTLNLPVRIADESSAQFTPVQTIGKGEQHGGSTEYAYASDRIGERPIWNLQVKSIGVDYDYLSSRYIGGMPFRTPADGVDYFNSLIDVVTKHELEHALGADHINSQLVLKGDSPSHPSVSLMANAIHPTYDYHISPGGTYVTGELVTDLVPPESDPALIATTFINKSLETALASQSAALGARGFEE